jgi:hypothetical protein
MAAGCATSSWQKPGVDAVTLNQDLSDCQRSAQVTASQFALASPRSTAPMLITTPSGATAMQTTPMPGTMPDPAVAQQYTVDCMHRKGYQLVRERPER